ncbi:MAG TPA: peptide MFS transporter [Thermoanaerobaculia bacterium]|jgi:POT family proton-dependent oligopeptide transporter|nr:peptide MFS transporter [Thermoanaerobaculia bacterium]
MPDTPDVEIADPATGTHAGQAVPVPERGSFFGHPAGLSTLFFTEMWERFSYYGMRAILLLFMTASVAQGGLGWDTAKAGPIYGLYTAMVYLTALPGGWIADRLIGQRRAVLVGGIFIALGHVSLTFHVIPTFYLGLVLIVIGTGLLKPNISTMVGSLYTPEDKRRDAGFSIFYMGINLGAFIAPIIVGFLAQSIYFRRFLANLGLDPRNSWHWGFGMAAIGMGLGLVQYVLGQRRLGTAGLPLAIDDPSRKARDRRLLLWVTLGFLVLVAALVLLQSAGMIAIDGSNLPRYLGYALAAIPIIYFVYLFTGSRWTKEEKRHLWAIVLFFIFAALFWSAFEQAGSTLNLFAERLTRNSVFGFPYPASWYQAINSFFIWTLAPGFAWLWIALGRRRREPTSPTKFAYGLFFVGVGFLVMVGAALSSGPQGGRVSPAWLLTVYLLHTFGELCLSPVGLSTMTKLAPARVVGQMMGIWFLATSVGNFIGGQVAGQFEKFPLPRIFGAVFGVTMLFTLINFLMIRPLQRLMGEVH